LFSLFRARTGIDLNDSIMVIADNHVPRISGDEPVLSTGSLLLKRLPRVSENEPGGGTCVFVVPRMSGVKLLRNLCSCFLKYRSPRKKEASLVSAA